MWIVQLSDFHFQKSSDIDTIINKTDKALDAISTRIGDDRDLIFCFCGDITEKGSKDGYEIARIVLTKIISRLNNKHINFEFVPGNHDLCDNSFSDFDGFVKEFTDKSFNGFTNASVAVKNYNDFDIVLINSIFHKDCSYGSLDIKLCEQLLTCTDKPKIALIHHTLLSRYDDDISTIRNGYKFSNILSNNNFTALLHGHTHGYSDFVVGKNCPVIGVGPIFKQIPDVNNQFNLIKVFRGRIISVENYFYRSDIDKFESIFVLENNYKSHFFGSSASKIQLDLLEEIKENGLIFNLSFNVKTKVNSFYEDIENSYSEVIPKAKNWIAEELPLNLPYNHAQYFNKDKNDGMNYVIEELNRKPTSSRALISLINTPDVVKSDDGFLPALNILQFGFKNDTRKELYISVYLRAIEVKHFLPINLCEIYLLSKRITDHFRATEYINITVNAFRAQYKEVFGCHEKANLDVFSQAKLMQLFIKKNIPELRKIIKEKIELPETVIIDSGIRNLSICMTEIEGTEDESFYGIEFKNIIYKLQAQCDRLIALRKSTSVYLDIEIAEKTLLESLNELEILLSRIETTT